MGGTLRAVPDGSYKDGKGSAGFIIQSRSGSVEVKGEIVSPGPDDIQSPYRSELLGIYAATQFLTKVIRVNEIKEGIIEIKCDGERSLYQALGHTLKLTSPCQNISEKSFLPGTGKFPISIFQNIPISTTVKVPIE